MTRQDNMIPKMPEDTSRRHWVIRQLRGADTQKGDSAKGTTHTAPGQ